MLKIKNVLKNHKKFFCKFDKDDDIRNRREIYRNRYQKQIINNRVLNEKFSFFLKDNKPFNFVDFYINKNEEEKLKKINIKNIFHQIKNSLDNKIIDKKIINLSQNLFYMYNSPNCSKLEFKENLKNILDKIVIKDKNFFNHKNNLSFFVKILSFVLKGNINYKIQEILEILKKLKLNKEENNILINSIHGYLIKNTKFMDKFDLDTNIHLLENFIDLVIKENLTKLFKNNIDKFFLLLTSNIVNEKFKSFNYLESSINKINNLINKKSKFLNSFDIELFHFFIKCDYNLNEELFILDNVNLKNIDLNNLLIIFEGNNIFYNNKNILKENLSKIYQYYGKSYSQIKNRVIISKDFYNNLTSKSFETVDSKFYLSSLFANKFNDLDFFIDNKKLLLINEKNLEKMNYFFINCLIKNVEKDKCKMIINSVNDHFSKLTEIDSNIIKTLLEVKEENKTSAYHYYFLINDLKKNIERNLLIVLKLFLSDENLPNFSSKINFFLNSLKLEDLINLGFNVFTDKMIYLKCFLNYNEVDHDKYVHYFGFIEFQYNSNIKEKIKYSEYFRSKSLFQKQNLDKKILSKFYPLFEEDIKTGKINNFADLEKKYIEILNEKSENELEEERKEKIAEEKEVEKLKDFGVNRKSKEKEYINTLNEKEKLIYKDLFEEEETINGEKQIFQVVEDELENKLEEEKEQDKLEKAEVAHIEEEKEEIEVKNEEEEEEEDGWDYEAQEFPSLTYYYNMITKRIDNTFLPFFLAKNQNVINQFLNVYKKGVFSQNSDESEGIDIYRYVEKDFEMDIHNEMAWVFIDHDLKNGIEFSLKVQHFLGKDFDDYFLQKRLRENKGICKENDFMEFDSGLKHSVKIANSPFFNDTFEKYENNYLVRTYLMKHRLYVNQVEDEEIIRNTIN